MASSKLSIDKDMRFQTLTNLPQNEVCFNCKDKNPRWASVTFGVFICFDCAASHSKISLTRSVDFDSWTLDQLKLMSIGGNGRAHVFFKQQGWNDRGETEVESKYKSRVADLYKQLLSHEAETRIAEEAILSLLPLMPAAGHGNGTSQYSSKQHDISGLAKAPLVFPSDSTDKSLGAEVARTTQKPHNVLYDQKSDESVCMVSTTSEGIMTLGPSVSSCFQHVEDVKPLKTSSGGTHETENVFSPLSSMVDSGMNCKKPAASTERNESGTSTSLKIENTHEARTQFPNAKSISSRQFLADQKKTDDAKARASLQKSTASTAITSTELPAAKKGTQKKKIVQKRKRTFKEYNQSEIDRERQLMHQYMNEDWEELVKSINETKQKIAEMISRTTQWIEMKIFGFLTLLKKKVFQ